MHQEFVTTFDFIKSQKFIWNINVVASGAPISIDYFSSSAPFNLNSMSNDY